MITVNAEAPANRKRPLAAADPLIGASEISEELGFTRNHCWRLLAAGTFGTVVDVATKGTSKAQLRIRRSQLDSWIASRTIPAEHLGKHA